MENAIFQAEKFSLFLKRLLASKQVNQEDLLISIKKPLTHDFFNDFANWQEILKQGDEVELSKQLRLLRATVFAQLLVRDLTQLADLNEVVTNISYLADFCILQATAFAEELYQQRYGFPIGQISQQVEQITVIAMGKLGGLELNVSSDIDLILTYPENGYTNGNRKITNEEYFTKVAKLIIKLINEPTEYGQVFRVDTRLRPDGDAGAIVISEIALENYLIKQGREWERYAWIKARVVTLGKNQIHSITTPFVYRKYFDFNSFNEIRKLHKQIQHEISLEGLQDNIKLGFGGIREVEFIAQIFQLIRGGQMPELQLKGTRETFQKLTETKIISVEFAQILLDAYEFLRNLEHRLQYWDDKQTQLLPKSPEHQQALAESMKFANYADFLDVLNRHRNEVNNLFNDLLHGSEEEPTIEYPELSNLWSSIENPGNHIVALTELNYPDPQKIINLLVNFKKNYYTKYSPQVQNYFDQLIPQFLEETAVIKDNATTLERLLNFSQHISKRPSYLVFLQEYPFVTGKLISLLSKSNWISDYLNKHPILLDELINEELVDTNINWPNQKKHLENLLHHVKTDVEGQMNTVRHFQHGHIFHLTAQELEDLRAVENLSDQLAALADIILDVSLYQVWQNYNKAHLEKPLFGIIAYGKLGGKELTYSSDLDLVYVYLDDHPDANQIYNWYASRLTSFLSVSTSAGNLYNIDLRLRPNGDAGFLATDFNFFKEYQEKHAWIWEHQAITRARFICGDSKIESEFNAVRKSILMLPRNKELLKSEIVKMRDKMLESHPAHFEGVKHARGGITDVEFIVQYLVLAYAGEFEDLTGNLGNIALLKIAANHHLIKMDLAMQVGDAYRMYRKISHNKVLFDNPPEVNNKQLEQSYKHVKLLWEEIFNTKI